MLHFDDIVFGPIYSRRLGSSLGMNILPVEGKVCNFDCVYCECGWNKDGKGARIFPTARQVEEALEKKLQSCQAEGVHIDSITFSGNGEPTVNPEFPEIIDATIRLRDRFFPEAKVSVLSNATLVGRKSVADALKRVDNPILKIDASSDKLIAEINRPAGNYVLKEVIGELKKFEGNFVLQTMFLRSPDFDTAAPDAIEAWRNIVRNLHPREIMVYTIDRQTPDGRLGKYTEEEMRTLVQPLLDEGFNIQIRG